MVTGFKQLIGWFACLAIFGLISAVFVAPLQSAPDNAFVFVDDSKGVYYAPSCFNENGQALPKSYLFTARTMKYRPEEKCKNEGGFIQEGRSLLGVAFEKIGLLSPLPRRWNDDGSWNW